MTFRHPAERGGPRRGRFEQLAETASNFTSSPVFYALCLVMVCAFVAVHAAGLSLDWQHVAGDAMSAVTLLLLALLKNAERRAEHAVQRKLDSIAAALLAQLEGGGGQAAVEALRQAIRLEEEI